MKFTTFIGIFFYTALFLIIGVTLIAFAIHLITLDDVGLVLENIYFNLHLRIVWGIIGLLLILLNTFFMQILVGKFQRQKNIAFTNPSGEVTISLAAVEGLIKRLTSEIAEIKELRPDVIATKKGINVILRVSLWSDVHIPEITSKLQDLIRTRLQELLGIEEPIIVKINVVKIASSGEDNKILKKKREPEATVPFQGF